MTATFIDGTKIAEDIKTEVAAEVKQLQQRGIRPGRLPQPQQAEEPELVVEDLRAFFRPLRVSG